MNDKTKGYMEYHEFIERKTQLGGDNGFDPLWMPDFLYPFQQHLVEWATRKGRCALFADCGLGKTPMQLVWAENVCRKTDGRVLILTPLAVAAQTVLEGEKFGIDVKQSRDGKAAPRITVTNYQQLGKFNREDFAGVVCDESSILKNFDGVLRSQITDFMWKKPYRLLCTATAAPNDYIELGTSSEAVGELGFMDMVSRFFKKAESTTSRSDEFRAGVYRFRGHAERDFWRWVCSWARAVRSPSDCGFYDDGFKLPRLTTIEHVVKARTANPDYLFDMPAQGLAEQRAERRRTIKERCELAAELLSKEEGPAVAWCHLNEEGHLLERLIPGAVEVEGNDPDEAKEEAFIAFADGQISKLVSKPVIAGFGLNWQHCARQTFFPSHSYEQWYQAVRRCWRFGQKRDVRIDVISSEGERGVLANLQRKSEQAEHMFANLVALMNRELRVTQQNRYTQQPEIPSWL